MRDQVQYLYLRVYVVLYVVDLLGRYAVEAAGDVRDRGLVLELRDPLGEKV